MTQPAPSTNPTDLPLGRAFRLKDLPGRVARWLNVPPGRTGVALVPGSAPRTLPAGRHSVLSAFERLKGGGAGFAAGYVPAEPFAGWIKVDNLLSGDGELIDAAVQCWVQVASPERFFVEVALPRGVVPAGGVDLSGQQAHDALDACAQQYAAADLAAGMPTEQLLPVLQKALQPALQQGLRLLSIDFLSFRPAERRAEIAEKALALFERLQDAELRQKMAAAENEARLDEFIAQLDPKYQQQAALRAGAADAEAGKSKWARFYDWLKLETQQGALPWRIIGLARGEDAGQEGAGQPAVRPSRIRRWWLGRALWMMFVVLATLVLTRIISTVSERLGVNPPWEVLWAVYGFGLVGVLESIKWLYEKREEISQLNFAEPGTTFLDDLTRNNRARADQLVRSGCKRELTQGRDMLNELRGRAFRQGKEDLAMQLRDLEKRLEQAARRVEDPAIGPAPYLSDLKINRQVWEDMLNYDEELLVRVAALLEDLRKVQQQITQAGSDGGRLLRVSDCLDEFLHRFEARGRALRARPKDMEVFQIK